MYTWRSSYISNNFDSHCLWRLCVWSLFCNALPRALTWVLKTGVPEPSLPKVGLPTYHKEYIASFKKQELQHQKFDMYRENLKKKQKKKKTLKLSCQKLLACFEAYLEKWSLGNSLPKLFKLFGSVEKHDHKSGARVFLIGGLGGWEWVGGFAKSLIVKMHCLINTIPLKSAYFRNFGL